MSKKPVPGVQPPPLVEATLNVMTELAQVLGEEIKLLKKNDVTAIRELLRRKSKLVINYQSNMKSIAANPDLVKQASAGMRARLKTSGLRLAEVTERNATVLVGAVTGTQRLIQHIIKTVKEEALPKKGYSDPRMAHMELGTYSPTCLPVAVNRTA
jgi:flagellar biosynthesis/type III secretory pathway chaperone